MTHDLLTTITDDGWGDVAIEANQRVLRGTLLKFADWNWSRGKEAEPIEKGTQLVATGTAAAWVRWEKGRPVETRLRPPGTTMPEREELGSTDETAWEVGPDKRPKDPWQNTRFVYLIDPLTAEAFTFSTSSFGGREAVVNLGDAIARMRSAHPDASRWWHWKRPRCKPATAVNPNRRSRLSAGRPQTASCGRCGNCHRKQPPRSSTTSAHGDRPPARRRSRRRAGPTSTHPHDTSLHISKGVTHD